MLRFPRCPLNLAARPGDGGHPVFVTALGGLLRRHALVGAALWLAACSRSNGPIVIGLAGPFSQPRGASMLKAAQLAVHQLNATRGGRRRLLELQIADDSGSEDVAVRVAETLYGDPAVVAVVGHLTSGTTIAAARVYGAGATPVVMISPSASSPDLSGISPYAFRVCPSDLQHGPSLARFAWQSVGARRAGIIYINNDYGRGVRRTFAGEFARLGGTVVEADPYVPATASLEPYLSRMRRQAVDLLVLAAERPGAELALGEMRTLGIAWPVVGGDALTGIEADGALAEGVRVSSAYLPDRRDERNLAFVADYARAYPGERPDHRGAGAYDAVFLLAQAIDAGATSRRALRDYLTRVGHGRAQFDGVTGAIAFDANGDVPTKTVVIGVVRGGRLVTQAEQ
jgi:branched-chain amino acid transport system substrate-binding protein